jgi:hypothetical protein
MSKSIELDIPTDPAERVRRQDEYKRMKAPLPAWLGPDTPERRMQLQMFVETIAAQDAADELGKCPECGLPYYGGDGSYPHCCDCAEDLPADEATASPAVLRAMLHLARLDASRAQAELHEIKQLAPAHRAVVPVVTMQAIADAIIKRAHELQGKNLEGVDPHNLLLITDGQLSRIIMQEFDKELG